MSAVLAGRVAIVSGAAQGIGAASARALAMAGARVVLGDVKDAAGQEQAQQLRAEGFEADYRPLDVTDPVAWADIVAYAQSRHGRIDCLVNNAGIDIPATIEDARPQDLRRILDVNLFSQLHGMQAVIPVMKAAGGGSIVNISSLATKKFAPTGALYAPSKAAAAALAKSAALHLAQQRTGIRVNTVHPGPTATAILLGDDGGRAESPDIKAAIGMIPMARMGEPDEIGAVVLFLASDASSYLTGAELFADGGLGLV
ncbi:SDR family NAD(P)-dependent oxidoreductase [Rhizorhabdus argentea]|uniref:SDR family NAD(P)-dependent oxidoreductase n=1 Tax=Rhizorhabdus argentea TaxID=1387174 RepID=UPI0030EBEA62